MICRYELEGKKTFDNVEQLDDFLLSKYKYKSRLGDAVFSTKNTQALNNATRFGEECKNIIELNKKRIRQRVLDKDDPYNSGYKYVRYVGVTTAVSRMKDPLSGDWLAPQFVQDNYFDKLYSQLSTGNVTGENTFWNPTDIEILFGDADNAEKIGKSLSKEEFMKQYAPIIQSKWEYQAKYGNAVHDLLQGYFTGIAKWNDGKRDKSSPIRLIGTRNPDPVAGKKARFDAFMKMIRGDFYTSAYFDDTGKVQLMSGQMVEGIPDTLISDEDVRTIFEIAESRYMQLRRRAGLKQGDEENFTIFSEYAIADKDKQVDITDFVSGNTEQVRLAGSIDIMVLHEDGTPDIIDWKTSPDDYRVNGKVAWNPAKIRTYGFQLGFYRQILGRNDFNTTRTSGYISPIIIGKIHGMRDADGKMVFSNDPIDLETNNKYGFEDITPQMNSENIKVYVDRIMEPGDAHKADIGNEHLVEQSQKDIAALFGNEGYAQESLTSQQLKEEFDEFCGKNEKTGLWVYYRDREHKYRVTIGGKPITASTPEEMYEKINAYKTDKTSRRRSDVVECANKVDQLLRGVIDESEFNAGRYYGARFYELIGHYTASGWTMVENQQALNEMGLIAFHNKLSGQIDVICLTNEDPYGKVRMKKGKLLTANFYNDLVETTKNSPMLEALNGNFEMMKAMLVLNNTKLFDNGTNFIGNIRVFDTDSNRQMHALNSKLKYSFTTIARYVKDSKGERVVKVNPKMKMGTDEQMVKSMLIQVQKKLDDDLEMAKEAYDKGVKYQHNELFSNRDKRSVVYFGKSNQAESLSSFLMQGNLTKMELEQGYMHILEVLEQNYGKEFRTVGEGEFSVTGVDSEIRALYVAVSRALAELNGIELNQQTFQSDKYSQYGIKGILTKGWTSLQMSNPGMFASDVINNVTNLLKRSYQDIRDRMQPPIAVFKKLEDRMIAANNIKGGVFLTNKEDIWKEFYVQDDKGNVSEAMMFKHPEEIADPVKREILRDLLTEINRYRFFRMSRVKDPATGRINTDMLTDEEVWAYKDNPRFYFIPLARSGWVDERGTLSNNGITWAERYNSIKENLFNLDKIKENFRSFFSQDELPEYSREMRNDPGLFKMNESIMADAVDNVDDRIKKIRQLRNEDRGDFTMNAVLSGATMAFNQVSTEEMDKVLLLAKAAIMHLRSEESEMKGVSYKNDIEYLLRYIKGVIKSEDLTEASMRGVADMVNDFSKFASFAVLGLSPVQFTYQHMQGIMQNLSAATKKYLGDASFGMEELKQAMEIVYSDVMQKSDSKVALLNQAFGVNDMDMNDYIKHAQDRKNIRSAEGLYKLCMMTSSRPDYYNRMVLIVAQMIKDGTWDAYYVEDGLLKYDFKKDKRFDKLSNPDAPHDAEWRKQKGLYDATAREMLKEGTRYTFDMEYTVNGERRIKKANSFFEYDGKDVIPLPKAYPSRQTDGYKNIADDVYGYYTHENKAAIHLAIIGKMFMQFKTFFSGKANQYFAPGKVRMRGTFEQMTDNDGNPVFQGDFEGESLIVRRQKADGSYGFYYIDTDEEIPGAVESDYIPFYQWKGKYQEGVAMTLANIIRMAQESDKDGAAAFLEAVRRYRTDEFTRDVFHTNWRQFINDILIRLLIGGVVVSIMMAWYKEIADDDDVPGIAKSSLAILTRSLKNSQLDSDIVHTFWSVFGNWTPFTVSYMGNMAKNISGVVTGNKSMWDAVCSQISGINQVKETVEDIVA